MSNISIYSRNIFFNWAGFAANMVVALYVSRLVLLALGEERASVWALIVSVVGTMGLVDFGLRPAFFRQVNALIGRGESHRINEFASSVLTCFLVALVPLVIAAALCGAFFGDIFPKVSPEFRAEALPTLVVMALFLGASMMATILDSVLDCHERFDLRNIMTIVTALARGGGAAWVLHLDGGLTLLGLSQLAANLLWLVGSWILVKRVVPDFRFSPRLTSLSALKELTIQGIPLFFHGASLRITFYTASFLIAWLVDPVLVVHYSYASQIVNYGGNMISLTGRVFVPRIHRMAAGGDLAGLRYFVPRTTRMLMGPVILIIVGSVVYGPDFLGLFYGEKTAAIGALILPLIGLASFGSMSTIATRAVLIGAGRANLVAIYSLIECAVSVAASVILVTVFDLGLVGIALGTAIAIVLVSGVLVLLRSLRHIHLAPSDFAYKTIAWWAPATVLFAAVAVAVMQLVGARSWAAFGLEVGVATILFAPVCWLLILPGELRQRFAAKFLRRRNRPGS